MVGVSISLKFSFKLSGQRVNYLCGSFSKLRGHMSQPGTIHLFKTEDKALMTSGKWTCFTKFSPVVALSFIA